MAKKEKVKIDSRIRRTKRLLREGLTQLIMQKSINKISVRELANLIEINRGTFYLHYKDICDLVEQTENELCEDLIDIIDETMPKTKENTLGMFLSVCEFLDENRGICRALLSDNGDINFLTKIKNLLSEKCFDEAIDYCDRIQDKSVVPYIISYFEAGSMGVVNAWLADDSQNRKTSNEIALLLRDLYTSGFSAFSSLK